MDLLVIMCIKPPFLEVIYHVFSRGSKCKV